MTVCRLPALEGKAVSLVNCKQVEVAEYKLVEAALHTLVGCKMAAAAAKCKSVLVAGC